MNSVDRSDTLSVFRRAGGAAALAFVLVLAPACGGDDDGSAGDVDAGAGEVDASAGPVLRTTEFVANHVGSILLTEGQGGFINYGAFFTDRIDVPPATLVASEGDCEVWTHPTGSALCDPPCSLGYCEAEDTCVPFPELRSHGEITVEGLAVPVVFRPIQFGGYLADPPSPPEELFVEGAAIAAKAGGADGVAFDLTVTGVAALEANLELEFGHTLTIEDGVDETIRWTAAAAGRIQLALLVGHHGSPFEAMLVCETEDDGELVVPGGIISRFPRAQPTGLEQHTSWLARFDRDVFETNDGPIEVFLSNRVIIPQLAHP